MKSLFILLFRCFANSSSFLRFLLSIGLFVGLFGHTADAQVVINEVCTYNADGIEDSSGDEPDWFELYNAGSAPVSLSGYYVTDQSLNKWYFPEILINPGDFLLVFASGKNLYQGELHTNFTLSKDGERLRLFDASGALLDEVKSVALQMDHSFGRTSDASSTFGIFKEPTPAASNNSEESYRGYVPDPVFSQPQGFYAGHFILAITADSESEIYYTIDGSHPDDDAAEYEDPIESDTSIVVCARAFPEDSDWLPSAIVTNTYMVNYTSDLPVFCITTDPENLWDWEHGIFVMGPNADSVYPFHGANFWMDWEVPAHVEFYETTHKQVFEQDIGLSINGGSVSRTRPQQSLRLTCRSKYGASDFNHRFFEDRSNDHFKILVLRNSSGDFNKLHFRDGSLHKLMIGQVDIDLLAYRPAAIFINGQYWGVLNIREKFSKHYLSEHYPVDEDNVDLLEEDSTLIQGDFTAFNTMHDFITGHDMSDTVMYEAAGTMLDIHSFCDYIIAETFLSNIDWPYNNIKYWRERKEGAKWRYLLMDLDISLGNIGWAPADLDALGRILGPFGNDNKHVQLFESLLANAKFRNYFINRYADLMNTLFTSEHMFAHIAKVMDNLKTEMPKHFSRWGNNMDGWNTEFNAMLVPYVLQRNDYARQYVQDNFALNKQVDVTLDVWPHEAGIIHINTIQPGPYPWRGVYYDGVPVSITAVANQGFRFLEWQSIVLSAEEKQYPIVQRNLDTDSEFLAVFEPTKVVNGITLFPNPANEVLKIGYVSRKITTGNIYLKDASGRLLRELRNADFTEGANFYEVDVTELQQGVYFLTVVTQDGVNASPVMIMHK